MRVAAADDRLLSPGFFSKYSGRRFLYPSPAKDPRAFCDYLLRALKKDRYEVLFPVHDFDLIPIAEERASFLPFVKMVLPPQKALRTVLDKESTLNLARELGIPVPETFVLENIDQLSSLIQRLPFPVVVKPRRQVYWTASGANLDLVGEKNYASSPEDLAAAAQQALKRGLLPLIQSRVTGIGAGVAALFKDGEPRALFSYRRIREYPVTGGPSTLRESTDDRRLKVYAEQLLRALNWNGVAMVEFKINERTGEVWLMEINGRFWGSIALPIAAGVDFPYLAYQLATQGDIPMVKEYRIGVRARWLFPGDLLWLLNAKKTGTSTFRAIRAFLQDSRVHYDYESWDDPMPAFVNLLTSIDDGYKVLRGTRSIYGEYLTAG